MLLIRREPLTQGQLQVDKIIPHGIDSEELLILAASVEQESSHILARSLLTYVQALKISIIRSALDAKEITAQGIQALIGSDLVKVGKLSLMPESAKDFATNQTTIYVSKNNQFIGYISFKDAIRPESKQTIENLKAQGIKRVIMLTGDKSEVANAVAKEVGIDEVRADCLPSDKIARLKETKEDERPIIMVGDGVNDAPALAIADVGIAMGAHGSTATSESADAVILKDDLSKVAQAIKISQDTLRVAKQSVLAGLLICLILMLIASTGASSLL